MDSMFTYSILRLRRTVLSGVLGMLLAGAVLGQPTRSSFPTPVNYDTDTQVTTFYLHLDAESPQASLSQVVAAAGSGSPAAFAQQVVAALVTGNSNAFNAMADPNGEADLAQIFSRYQVIFSGAPDPLVRDIFYLGGLRYFVMDTGHPQAPIVPLPILESGGGHVHAFSLLLEPMVQNVSALARNRKLFSSTYGAVASPNYNTEIQLPGLFGDSAGDHPLSLRFSGYFIGDNGAVGSKASPAVAAAETQRALEFYRSYRQAMLRRDKESLPSYFGDVSRQKLQRFFELAASRDPKGEATWKWLQGAPTQGADPGLKTAPTPNPRYIIILNSSYIFFKQGSENEIDYEYVRLGSSGYEVVNFQRQTILDAILAWPPVADELKDEIAGP